MTLSEARCAEFRNRHSFTIFSFIRILQPPREKHSLLPVDAPKLIAFIDIVVYSVGKIHSSSLDLFPWTEEREKGRE